MMPARITLLRFSGACALAGAWFSAKAAWLRWSEFLSPSSDVHVRSFEMFGATAATVVCAAVAVWFLLEALREHRAHKSAMRVREQQALNASLRERALENWKAAQR